MSDIKTTIGVLCDILKFSCDFEMKPVWLKLAKYDKTDDNVVQVFWNLLNILCQNDSCENQVQNVKIYFAALNYNSLEFYSLPDDGNYGSRELLIAFSWLLGKNEILQRLIQKKILQSKISQEFDTNLPKNPPQQEVDVTFKTVQEYQNYILSICGKINTNIKANLEYNSKTVQLLHKIHTTTEHLSTEELFQLKNSGNFSSYLKEIKPLSDLIDALVKWKSNEKYFWKWMMTVIELKNENKVRPLDKSHLISFFKCLRKHVKQILKEDENQKQKFNKLKIEETKFPRCVQSDEDISFEIQLNKLENTLKTVKQEEKRNLKVIYEYLRNLL